MNSYDYLIKKAKKTLENSYSPYSNFKVAACAVDIYGNEYIGVNVENVTYGATICAERNAIFSGISMGSKKYKTIVIYSESKNYTMPCGICRQVMFELCTEDCEIICANKDGEYKIFNIKDLYPNEFKI
jgi:cytidine deaminase